MDEVKRIVLELRGVLEWIKFLCSGEYSQESSSTGAGEEMETERGCPYRCRDFRSAVAQGPKASRAFLLLTECVFAEQADASHTAAQIWPTNP